MLIVQCMNLSLMIATIKWKETDREGTPVTSVEDLLSELRAISGQTTPQKGIAAVLDKPQWIGGGTKERLVRDSASDYGVETR